jgi:hypothetical protein
MHRACLPFHITILRHRVNHHADRPKDTRVTFRGPDHALASGEAVTLPCWGIDQWLELCITMELLVLSITLALLLCPFYRPVVDPGVTARRWEVPGKASALHHEGQALDCVALGCRNGAFHTALEDLVVQY